ncbi:MAG TPA: hydroxylamine reductase [Candidatus Methanomethylophilaceae archaeon]|nr:hydroxylamine reductase [Candidatus Methanomethylophilaceae archaeon]
MTEMFCFQCEQTAKGIGCTGKAGVCTKSSQVSNLQDDLISALVDLANKSEGKSNGHTDDVISDALFRTITNVDFSAESIKSHIDAVKKETSKFGGCGGCGGCSGNHFKLSNVWTGDEDIRSLKSLILFGLKGIAAYAYHAKALGYEDKEVYEFMYKALIAIGSDMGQGELLPIVLETGEANLKCMKILDEANTKTYGVPEPNTVSLKIHKGPFIIVTGHDLLDLKILLEQTKDKGIDIYTHGEMLPAHGYPELRKYKHFVGHFGTAWQNQRDEFDDVPAPILYTTNCLMKPKDSYSDRIFTTGPVAYPNTAHIDEDKDFTPLINMALDLGGYKEDVQMLGMNGGKTMTTGYSSGTILSVADKVVEAVNSGALKHIFLVGGCDGAKLGRNYFTDFVKETPKDTLVLTLACGKFRFNDLDIGDIGGIPRLLDVGQCNDAYGAVVVALALADAFKCSVNELPLSIVLSWYEQKAVAILLTLLHLGIQNIYLGPTIPAFVSPNILNYLVENFGVSPISTPAEDMKKMLG